MADQDLQSPTGMADPDLLKRDPDAGFLWIRIRTHGSTSKILKSQLGHNPDSRNLLNMYGMDMMSNSEPFPKPCLMLD
jgi:hypothetical protein